MREIDCPWYDVFGSYVPAREIYSACDADRDQIVDLLSACWRDMYEGDEVIPDIGVFDVWADQIISEAEAECVS